MSAQRVRSSRTSGIGVAAACACLLGVAGCSTAVRWELGTFDDAFARSVKQNKLTFVYFRSWYSVDCTNFEDQVLSHPRVLAALDALVAVPLEYDWDKPLADRWGLTRTPATAIVDRDRQVLAKTNGVVSVQQMLDALSVAAAAQAPAQSAPSQPSRTQTEWPPTEPPPPAPDRLPPGDMAPAP